MSQRRQDERNAARERRREQRRAARVEQRRTQTQQSRPNASVARELAAAKAAAEQQQSRAKRTRLIAIGGVAGVALIALVAFLLVQQFKPLPGVGFDTNGNQHVDVGEAHGAYFSNPPTSGWHFSTVPNPGIYSEPRQPEELPHFMEHGGVWVLYTCPNGDCPTVTSTIQAINEARSKKQEYTCASGDTQCSDLVALFDFVAGQHERNRPVSLAPYPAKGNAVPEQKINVIAWQRMLSLDSFDREKIADFAERMACRYNPESAGWCGIVRGKFAEKTADAPDGFNARTATVPPSSPAGVGPTPPPSATPAR